MLTSLLFNSLFVEFPTWLFCRCMMLYLNLYMLYTLYTLYMYTLVGVGFIWNMCLSMDIKWAFIGSAALPRILKRLIRCSNNFPTLQWHHFYVLNCPVVNFLIILVAWSKTSHNRTVGGEKNSICSVEDLLWTVFLEEWKRILPLCRKATYHVMLFHNMCTYGHVKYHDIHPRNFCCY